MVPTTPKSGCSGPGLPLLLFCYCNETFLSRLGFHSHCYLTIVHLKELLIFDQATGGHKKGSPYFPEAFDEALKEAHLPHRQVIETREIPCVADAVREKGQNRLRGCACGLCPSREVLFSRTEQMNKVQIKNSPWQPGGEIIMKGITLL